MPRFQPAPGLDGLLARRAWQGPDGVLSAAWGRRLGSRVGALAASDASVELALSRPARLGLAERPPVPFAVSTTRCLRVPVGSRRWGWQSRLRRPPRRGARQRTAGRSSVDDVRELVRRTRAVPVLSGQPGAGLPCSPAPSVARHSIGKVDWNWSPAPGTHASPSPARRAAKACFMIAAKAVRTVVPGGVQPWCLSVANPPESLAAPGHAGSAAGSVHRGLACGSCGERKVAVWHVAERRTRLAWWSR